MFYLTTHSTHFIALPHHSGQGVQHARLGGRNKGGSVLFNDALDTFYLRLYGVGYMVKDH